jgi:exopolyphosphatase/guanosine-5'-triphosphate,3'-diphosphate pyrophosphatase
MSVAAIDCGTNSVRLLIAEVDAAGILHEQLRIMRIVRLGEGIDRTGEFSQSALSRLFGALDEFGALISQAGVEQVRFVATSASRDARNRDEFLAGVRTRIGVDPEVIPGTEEAALSFVGAVRGLPTGLVRLPALVVDIGGGSTEFVLGETAPRYSVSVDVGCVRMTERHLASDPPTAAEISATRADIRAAVARAGQAVPFDEASTLVGLAGSVTTVAAMALDLPEYDETVLHGSVITARQVAEVADAFTAMTRAQRAALPYMHPGRVDVIAGGAMVLDEVMVATGAEQVVVSETDILDGIVYSMGN